MSIMSQRGERDSEQQQQASGSSKKQVVPYKAFYEMRNYVEDTLGLRRVFIQNLPDQDDLVGCYVGGRIINAVSPSAGSGGRSMVFVEDSSDLGMDALRGTLRISQELMDQLPALDDQFMLFVGGASLEENDDTEFTQDTGKDVIVDGSGVTLWVIHPRIDDPKLYQKTSVRRDWWIRRRKRKKMAGESKTQWKRERLAAGNQEDRTPLLTTSGLKTMHDVSGGRGKEEGELSSKPGPSNADCEDGIHEKREHRQTID